MTTVDLGQNPPSIRSSSPGMPLGTFPLSAMVTSPSDLVLRTEARASLGGMRVRCPGAFKRIPTPESTLITNTPGRCGRSSAHGWAVADGEPAELELIGYPDGWRPKDPQVKSSPTLEQDGPDGSEEEETDEREGEGNEQSHQDRDDVDARDDAKEH